MIKVKDLFDVVYGVNLEYNKMTPDKNGIPFVSRGSVNNGVVGYVKKGTGIKCNPSNTISVAGSGSVLESFLQEAPYYSGRDLYYLNPKQFLSKNQMLYYCMVLRSNKYRYSYGRQANRTLGDILIPSLEELPEWVNEIELPNEPSSEPTHKKEVSLNDREWDCFELQEVFTLKKGKRLTSANMIAGNTPFIGAIDDNNGYREFIGQEPIHEGNTITVNYNGSVGVTFYQPEPFWASDDVNVLYANFHLNKYIAMFIATVIKQEKYRFSFGRKWKLDRMERSKIKLPITKDSNPDWQFMEYYIKSLPYSSNLESNRMEKGLSDEELVEKYEKGKINLKKELKKAIKN